MPSNYSQTMNNPQVGSVASEYTPDTARDANLINRMGQSLDTLGKMFKSEDKSKDALAGLSVELADIENQNIAYQQELSDLQVKMVSADDEVARGAAEEFAKLRAGVKQGRLPQSSARIRTNDIIKKYSVLYPHLAQDIRTMANASMDNYREIANEIMGDDPVSKAAAELATAAYSKNTTPQAEARQRGAAAKADALLKRLEVEAKNGMVDENNAIDTIQQSALSYSMAKTHELAINWYNALSTGQMSGDDVIVQVGALRYDIYRKHLTELTRYGVSDQDKIKSALGPAMMLVENMETMLKSTGTVENQVKYLKSIQENKNLQSESKMMAYQEQLNGLLGYLPANEMWDVVQAAAAVLTSPISIDTTSGLEAWQAKAESALVTTNKATISQAVRLAQSPEGRKIVAEMVGGLLAGQDTGADANPVTDALAKRTFDAVLGRMQDPALKREKVANAIVSFSWEDITRNPETRKIIASDPALVAQAANKAAQVVANVAAKNGLDVRKIKVDHSNKDTPISIEGYKPQQIQGQPYGADLRTASIAELNKVYKEVLTSFGAAGVEALMSELKMDKKPKAATTGDSKKKVSKTRLPPEDPNPQANVDKVLEYNKGYQLPQEALMAMMDMESSLGKFNSASVDAETGKPLSTARGPLHILAGTFKEVNTKYFGGELSWDNPDDVIVASLAHFKALHAAHNGDLASVFRRWYGSTDSKLNEEYAANVLKRMTKYANG